MAVALGLSGARQLLGLCKNRFTPPDGSPSQVAHSKIGDYFGDDQTGTEVMYFEVLPGHSVFDRDLLKSVTRAVGEFLKDRLADDVCDQLEVQGYYQLLEKGPPYEAGAPSFVSVGNTSSFFLLRYPKENTQVLGKALFELTEHLKGEFAALAYVGDSGMASVDYEAIRAATRSIESMDVIGLPIAFFILAVNLQSPRLLLLPLLTLILSIIVSFGIMGFIAMSGMLVSSAAPPVMMSMLLAISIDYALFLLARFREERGRGAGVPLAVERTIRYSGHTILGSGFTLAFCFLSLLFFPLQLMRSIGVGVIVSILVAISVNLTAVPACLLCMPAFFSKSCTCSRRAGIDVDGSASAASAGRPGPGVWDKWAKRATSIPAFGGVLVLLLAVGYFSLSSLERMEKSVDTFLMTPRGAPTTETSRRLGQSFSKGQTGPLKLLLLPRGSGTIYSPEFWGNATQLLQEVVGIFDEDSRAHGAVQSVVFEYNIQRHARGLSVPMELAKFLDPGIHDEAVCEEVPHFLPLEQECEVFVRTKSCEALSPLANATARAFGIPEKVIIDTCDLFQLQFGAGAAPHRDALVATLTPSQQPGSKQSVDWTRKCRGLLESGRHPALHAHLDGVSPQIMDAIDAIYDRAPFVLALTMVFCLIFIGLITVSVAFAVVSVILIAWTMVVVYGFGIAVYQDGLLGAGAPAQLAATGGLAWLVLPLTFTVVLGLGLDYDIFLLGRVCEYRCQGLTDRAAIANGVAKTGPVITSAGIIMAVAFSGLMLSDIPMLNQVSLLLVTAVLVDTFFIRSLATPAIHAPLGRLNWWPRRVPEATSTEVLGGGIETLLCSASEAACSSGEMPAASQATLAPGRAL